MRFLPRTAGLAFTLSCAAWSSAFGQDAQSTSSDSASDQGVLAEVVVTAEKREASEQKTPIAMSVFSTEALEKNGVGNLADLTAIAPSVSFGRSNATSVVTIRGVSSRDTTEIGDPAVAISLDGSYFQRAIGLADSIYDLERVEVLRGPQGTLYGRNATGGAINFITAKPTKEFGGRAQLTVGNYDLISSEAALNLPLSDRVQLRGAFYTSSRDGYRDNRPARSGDDSDAKAGRLHLAVQPTDNLSALFTAEFVNLGGIGPAVYGTPLVLSGGSVVHTPQPLPSDNQWAMGTPSGFMDSTSKSLRMRVDYDLGAADITYMGSYRRLDYHALTDLDGTDEVGAYFQANEKPRTVNHELRIASDADAVLTWQAGAFYFKEENDLLTYFQDYAVANPPVNLFIFTYPDIVAESKAVFAQGGYRFSDSVQVEAGVRYTKDEKTRVGTFDYGSGVIVQNSSSESSEPTYHVGVNWQATPANLLYAKYDTGYKAGGFTDAAPYDPEKIAAIEMGSKNRFFGNTVQLNVSSFFYDYSDQQVSQFIDGRTFIRNAGKSELYGLEVEASALVTPNDRIDGYVGYLHAEFTDFQIAAGAGNQQLAGNHPLQAPRWSTNVGYQHTFELGSGAGLTARLQSHYEDTSYLSIYNYTNSRQKSYTRSDVILTYEPADAQWTIEAFARNLEDERIMTAFQENGLWGTYNYQFTAPRTYGLRIAVNW